MLKWGGVWNERDQSHTSSDQSFNPLTYTIVLTGGCKMRSVASLLALILLATVCASCDFAEVPKTQAAQSGAVLFSDDFTNPNSGWDAWTQNGSAVSYQDGVLRIYVAETQYSFWSRPVSAMRMP
jgi:hypothetical protein